MCYCWFSLAAFNICSLCLIFVNLINMCLGVFHLGFILFGTPLVSCTWWLLPSLCQGSFQLLCLQVFSHGLSFWLLLWGLLWFNVGVFNIVPEVSEIILISFNSFFLSASFISNILSSTSLMLSSASIILLLVPSRVFWYQLLHYSVYIDSWISSRSLLNISCIFSVLVYKLFICNSVLFSRFWIIFTIIILNSFSGRPCISSSLVWFGGHLSCSFTCWVFLCLFILFRLLC